MCRAGRCILGHWGLERHAEAAPPGIDLVGHLARQEELRLDLDGRSVAGLKADLRRLQPGPTEEVGQDGRPPRLRGHGPKRTQSSSQPANLRHKLLVCVWEYFACKHPWNLEPRVEPSVGPSLESHYSR